MNKKLSVLILSLIACFAFVSCGDSKNPESLDSSGISSEETMDSSSEDSIEDSEETSEETSETDQENSSETEKKGVSVTFRQNGVKDIVVTLTEGEALTNVPVPAEKTGYTVVWDRTDFSSITEDIVVKAIETAKTYTVKLQANGGSVAQETLTVTYGQAYELPTPAHSEHIFDCWTYAGEALEKQGVWELDADGIVLTVKWNECCWSGNY